MGWFLRHLNWTVLFFTICVWVFAWLLVEFILLVTGMVYLPFPGQHYIHPSPVLVDFLPFTFQTIVDMATVFLMPVFFCILKRKNRSWLYLMFFVPPLIPVPYEAWVLLFLLPFWLTGWIILLVLRNK
jgi:hypothetical protein